MHQIIILGSILLVTLYVLKRMQHSNPKLNMPPLVRYKIPIIGHTFSFMFNSEEFFKQCRQEYGDIFSIYVWGQLRTIVGKEHMHEVFSKDESFNFNEGSKRLIPIGEMFKYMDEFMKSPRVLKDYVINKLKFYTTRMQKCIYSATKEYIGDCDEPKVIRNLQITMAKIISHPMANIFFGEEESKHEEIINTFTDFTVDVIKVARIPPFFDFIYPGLHNYVVSYMIRLGLFNPALRHRNVLIKHAKNQVNKRLQEKEKYGESWNRPNDYLQDIMEEEGFDAKNVNYIEIADKLAFFIFASVHSTSTSLTNAIIDLASRPEYIQELYEEQLEVQKDADENGILPFEALDKMEKLDHFVRESLRLNGHIAILTHAVLKDYTFSNGMQLPKGHLVDLYFDDICRDESSQGPNPKSFDPYRPSNMNATSTKIGRNYVVFGGGKHACPGRNLATNEIKFFMHNAILKYNFRTENGKIEEKISLGPMAIPSRGGIIFEKRVK